MRNLTDLIFALEQADGIAIDLMMDTLLEDPNISAVCRNVSDRIEELIRALEEIEEQK